MLAVPKTILLVSLANVFMTFAWDSHHRSAQ
jgi:uncharacterized protein (DUF486 family)